ncbi:MAG: hypothetical protein JJV95_01670 [Sulfurospirillum sp.]|nr:hypothetical protein [Sulfurospirillum sp.]MBL0702679.1 hypothetical protein [Sulfurospirillum sp.]
MSDLINNTYSKSQTVSAIFQLSYSHYIFLTILPNKEEFKKILESCDE